MVAGVSSDRSASSSLQVIRSTSFLIAIEYDENKCNKASLELHPTRTYVSRALAVGRSMQRSGSTVDSVLHPEEGGRVLVPFRPKPSVRPSCGGVSSCRFRIRSRVDALSTAERYIDRARWADIEGRVLGVCDLVQSRLGVVLSGAHRIDHASVRDRTAYRDDRGYRYTRNGDRRRSLRNRPQSSEALVKSSATVSMIPTSGFR